MKLRIFWLIFNQSEKGLISSHQIMALHSVGPTIVKVPVHSLLAHKLCSAVRVQPMQTNSMKLNSHKVDMKTLYFNHY